MPELIEDGGRFSRANVNAHRQQRVVRGAGSSGGKRTTVVAMRQYTSEEIDRMDFDALRDGMEAPPVGGARTGFVDFVRRQQSGQGRVASRRSEIDEMGSVAGEIARNQRALSGSSGFAAFAARKDAENHDNDRLDNEEGPDGFGPGFHGSSEDMYPEGRDKDMERGGFQVAGEELLQDETDDELTPHSKSDSELNRNPNGRGTSRKADELSFSLQTEVVDDSDLRDRNRSDMLADEPAHEDIPGEEDERSFQPPKRFEETDDHPLPGVSQSYPEKSVKRTQIMGAMQVRMEDGRTYIGKILQKTADVIRMEGFLVGTKSVLAVELDRDEVQSIKPYSVKPMKAEARKMDLNDLYGQAMKTAGMIEKEEGGPGSGRKRPGASPMDTKEITDEDIDIFTKNVMNGKYGKLAASDLAIIKDEMLEMKRENPAMTIDMILEVLSNDHPEVGMQALQNIAQDANLWRKTSKVEKTADSLMEEMKGMIRQNPAMKKEEMFTHLKENYPLMSETEIRTQVEEFYQSDYFDIEGAMDTEVQDKPVQEKLPWETEEDPMKKNEKTAAKTPIQKYLGNTPSKTKPMDKEEAIAAKDDSKGDGELYGDDLSMKDQLRQHERKAAFLKSEVASLLAESADADTAKQYVRAQKLLDEAMSRKAELNNLKIKVAEMKKQASIKVASGKGKLFFQSNETGAEGMFKEEDL